MTATEQAEAMIERLCATLAGCEGIGGLNVATLLTLGLMVSVLSDGQPLSEEQARQEAANLILKGVTDTLVQITSLTLDSDAAP